MPGINEIRQRIEVLNGHNEETLATIQHMKDKMKLESVPYISFEDKNTKGLRGAQRWDHYNAGNTYGIYAYKKLVKKSINSIGNGKSKKEKDRVKRNRKNQISQPIGSFAVTPEG